MKIKSVTTAKHFSKPNNPNDESAYAGFIRYKFVAVSKRINLFIINLVKQMHTKHYTYKDNFDMDDLFFLHVTNKRHHSVAKFL